MKKLFAIAVSVLLLFIFTGCGGGDKQVKDSGVTSSLYSLNIEGASYETLTNFKKDLAELDTIKNVYQKSFSKGETSELQVEHTSSTQVLADEIQNIDNDDYAVEVLGFDPSTIDLKLGAE